MSPTMRDAPAFFELDTITPARPPRVARCFAIALVVLAVALVAGLSIGGAPLPDPGLMLVLAIPLALCMNRYLFFPNEVGVTADAAVIFAALVAFRADAQWLGPLVLALLAGPLDARHWGARAFSRMAYNSGSTALVTAAALAVFVPLTHELGAGWEATLAAAGLGSVVYFATESLLGVVLVTLLGERPSDAFRHQVPLNALVVPLGVAGAAAGLTAIAVGWWCALALLLPVPFVPELVLVTIPRRLGPRRSRQLVVVVAGAVLVAASIGITASTPSLVVGLIGLASLLFVEDLPRKTVPLPPLGAALVVVPLAVSSTTPNGSLLVAVVAGIAYLAVASRFERRSWWSSPFVAFVVALGASVADRGSTRIAWVAVGLVVGLTAAAAWGSLPWSSRLLGRCVGPRSRSIQRPALALLGLGPPALLVLATSSSGSAPRLAALGATALVELGVFAAALAVRLWRFAPRRRALDLVLLASVGVGAATLVPLTERAPAVAVGVACCCTVVVARVVLPLPRPEGAALRRARRRPSSTRDR